MAASVVKRPAVVVRVTAPTLLGDDPALGRVVGQAVAAVGHLNDQASNTALVIVNLAVGMNRINHGLGRRARAAQVTPTAADASFAWGFTTDNDTQAIITVVGVPQANAAVEIK